MIELHHRQTRRVGERPGLRPLFQIRLVQHAAHPGAPIIEISSHQQCILAWNFTVNEIQLLLHLPDPTGRNQAEMHNNDMDQTLLNLQRHMQQTTLFQPVVGHILMLMRDHRPT